MPPTEGRDALREQAACAGWSALNSSLAGRIPWHEHPLVVRQTWARVVDAILAEIERGHVIVPADMLREVKAWADHFAPCVADDNNWYRDECPMDGKDAASLGELLAVLAVLAGDGEPRP